MYCLRRLAVRAGLVSLLLLLASCGMNPQPEPPSADDDPTETSGTGGAGGGLNAGPPGAAGAAGSAGGDSRGGLTPPADDAGASRKTDNETEEPNANDYASDPGNLGPSTGTPQGDAGEPGRDAGSESPPSYDGGVLSM